MNRRISIVITSILLGLLAALAFGIADLLAVKVVRKVGILRFLLWSHIAAIVVATPYALFVADLGQVPLSYVLIIAAVGPLILGMFASFYKSVQLAPVALAGPIVSAHLVVVILLAALLLDERLVQEQAAGIAVAMAGLILVSMAGRKLKAFPHQNAGVASAIVSMLAAGFFVFGLAFLSRELGWFIPVYLIKISTLLFIMPSHLIARVNPCRGMSLGLVSITALAGISVLCGLISYTLATQLGPVSIVATTFSVYPVFTAIGGVLFFRERLAPRQVVGVICVLGGLLAVAVTS